MISRNIKLLKIRNFFFGMWPLETLVVVYFRTITDSYATAMLVFSVMFLTQVMTEVPTGIFSDKMGRKKTLVLSSFTFFTAFLCWALAGTFDYIPLLFIGAFINGVAKSLRSGTEEALMYETMEEMGKSSDFDKLFSITKGLEHLGKTLSYILAAVVVFYFNSSSQSLLVLAWISVTLPVLGEIIPIIFCVEPKRRTETLHTDTSFVYFKKAFKFMMENKKLRIFVVLKVFSMTSSSCMVKMVPVYYAKLIPLYLVIVSTMIKEVANTISYFIIPYFKWLKIERRLFLSEYFMAGVRLMGIAINSFLTPFILAVSNIGVGLGETSIVSIMQDNFSKEQRATMSSIVSLLKALLSSVLFYVLGVVADIYSVVVAVVILILMRLFVAIYTSFRFRKLKL